MCASPVLVSTVFGLLCLLEVPGGCSCQGCCALVLKLCSDSLEAAGKVSHSEYQHHLKGMGSLLTSSRSWAEILTEYEKVSSSSSSTNCWGLAVQALI